MKGVKTLSPEDQKGPDTFKQCYLSACKLFAIKPII